PDRLGLGDEVADSEDEAALADEHAAPGALGAENARGKGVLGNAGIKAHHGGECPLDVERPVAGLGLRLVRGLPFGRLGPGRRYSTPRPRENPSLWKPRSRLGRMPVAMAERDARTMNETRAARIVAGERERTIGEIEDRAARAATGFQALGIRE